MRFTRYVGNTNRNQTYRATLRDDTVCKIDFRPVGGNVVLDFTLDRQPFALPMSGLVRDVVDVACMVYVADELEERATAVDRWTRGFEAAIPVRAPSAWRRASDSLVSSLQFLSGDRFGFEWLPTRAVPALRNHRALLPNGFDVVCLFSGGLDSFIGALTLLQANRRVILVGHQADGITSKTQCSAFDYLKGRFGDDVCFVQAGVRQSPRENPEFDLGEKMETSHRPRSFLFLSLAVAVAASAGIDEVVIPENGLIALNPPLNVSRIGTLSTRTAHPKFIDCFGRFLRELGVFEGSIRNPFMYLSKTDVVQSVDRRIRTRLRSTLSCSHLGRTRWSRTFRGQHCGYCVPCLYRRAALHAIEADFPEDYFRDVFVEFSDLSNNERTDVVALVRFARRVAEMSKVQRIATATAHGVIAPSALAAMGPETADPYGDWAEMLRRWSVGFLEMAGASASPEVRRRLGLQR